MRRLRRRAQHADPAARLFCRTNGCASFLVVDPAASMATCQVCGYQLRLH